MIDTDSDSDADTDGIEYEVADLANPAEDRPRPVGAFGIPQAL